MRGQRGLLLCPGVEKAAGVHRGPDRDHQEPEKKRQHDEDAGAYRERRYVECNRRRQQCRGGQRHDRQGHEDPGWHHRLEPAERPLPHTAERPGLLLAQVMEYPRYEEQRVRGGREQESD